MFKSIKRLSLTLLILPIIFFSTVSTLSAEPVRPVINSVIYSAVWGVTSFAGMEEAELTLNLTNTADLVAWQAKYAPSDPYTCGAEWSVADFEGKFNPVRTNTAPIYGGRRVENFVVWSQDISDNWQATAGITGTDAFLATAQYQRIRQTFDTFEDHEYVFSFTAHVPEGQLENYGIYHADSETGVVTDVALTNTPRRYSVKLLGENVPVGQIKCGFVDNNASNWATVIVTDLQFEEVTGQQNQNPSNHIATTTAAITEYLTTENGNTVDPVTHIVTEATGDTIENVMGGAFWPSTKNEVPEDESRDLTHINWIKSNGSITAGNVVLIDGTIVADKNTFTASAANATIIKTAYISASGVHSGGIFVRRKLGSNTIEVTIDGGITWVDVTDEIDSAIGYYLAQTTLPTVTNPQIGIRLTGSGDAVYLDYAQMDDGYTRVSSHPISGGATLAAQSLIAADATNASKLISDTQGYVIAHAMLMPDDVAVTTHRVITDGSLVLYGAINGATIRSNDGSTTVQILNAYDGYSKFASFWFDSSRYLTVNGSSLAGVYDGAWGSGAIYIGSSNGFDFQFNGIINQVIFGKGIKTTAAEMELETTPGYYCPVGTVFVRDANGDIITNNGEAVWAPR